MTVRMTGCACAGTELFLDLATYNYIDRWVEDMLAGRCRFVPDNLAVWFRGVRRVLTRDGKPTEDAQETLAELKSLSPDMLWIPNDRLSVTAHVLERELYVAIGAADT